MAKSKSDLDELFSKINRKAPKPPKVEREVEPASAPPPETKGQRVHIWMPERDSKQIRELAAWLAGQGQKISDGLILRTALRMVKPGNEFLEAYQRARKREAKG